MYDKYIETSSSKGRFWGGGGGTIYIYIDIYRHVEKSKEEGGDRL